MFVNTNKPLHVLVLFIRPSFAVLCAVTIMSSAQHWIEIKWGYEHIIWKTQPKIRFTNTTNKKNKHKQRKYINREQ
jgi:hypothetical protein